MFKRNHHNRIATILQSINASVLNEFKCYFGGGTAIALLKNEYRESIDIDFLVSDKIGYQKIRQLLTGQGIQAITRPDMLLETVRDIRADQYGIRTMLRAGDAEIKFEIVFEARIQFQTPPPDFKVCGIAHLTTLDLATTKMLANSDRWHDRGVRGRDLIDLAMLELTKSEFNLAIEKASDVYGESIIRDLQKAIKAFDEDKDYLEECMKSLKINTVPKAVLWKNIRRIRQWLKSNFASEK